MRILIDGQTLNTYEIKRGIGRVFLALINQLVNEVDRIDWYITISNKTELDYFNLAVKAKLNPIILDFSSLGVTNSLTYTHCLQQVIQQYHIDLYWNLNPLMPNVFFPIELNHTPMHVMLHDLIPKILGDIRKWPLPRKEEYLRRLTAITYKATHIVAISQCTFNDLLTHYPKTQSQCSIIPHGINHFQFYPRLVKIPLYGEPYILYVGGFDPRKNMFVALEAFAQLCHYSHTNQSLNFYVVCDANDEQTTQFYQTAEQLNIRSRVTLFSKTHDPELCELYANAELFFFPSRYEGFGLPVLEALASGIITVVSDTPALKEIAQEASFYCNPEDYKDMAKCLDQALNLPEQNKRTIINRGLEIAKEYRWEKTADQYLATLLPTDKKMNPYYQHSSDEKKIEGMVFQSKSVNNANKILKVAFATPWPPEKSGIANYACQLIHYLQSHCQVTIFKKEPLYSGIKNSPINQSIEISCLSQLEKRIEEFDFVVYQLGNDATHHKTIYELAWKHPGIIILHDYSIYQCLQEAFANKDNHALYQTALVTSQYYQDKKNNMATVMASLPLCESIIKRSLATIVHNSWVRRQLALFSNVHLIPHGAEFVDTTLSTDELNQLKTKLGIQNQYVIGVFGFMNYTKRFNSIVQAIANLYHKHYPIKLLVVGQLDRRHANISEICHRYHLPDDIFHITGYVDDETFINYLRLTDIFIGLRQPSMGETSGPLMKALGMGKPCIVSDYQQFQELPDDICFKIFTDEREIPHLTLCLENLLKQPQLREQMGINARHYIEKYATYKMSAQHLFDLMVEMNSPEPRGSTPFNITAP